MVYTFYIQWKIYYAGIKGKVNELGNENKSSLGNSSWTSSS